MSDDYRPRSRSPSPARDRSRSPVREERREARPEEPAKLFVGNLSFETTNDSLADAFSKYGPVVEARVVSDRDTGRSRGFGFVTFENVADADAAVTGMSGVDLQGREIRVDRTNANAPRGGGGRGGGRGGSFGGRGGGGYGGDRGGYGGDRGGYGGDRGGYGGDRGGYGGDRGGYGGDRGGYGGDRGGRGGYGGDRGGYGGDRGGGGGYGGDRGGYGGRGGDGGDRPKGACYAFQKGECRYGDSCRFAHN